MLFAYRNAPVHPFPVAVLAVMVGMYVMLTLFAKVPLRAMNLPVQVNDANEMALRPLVLAMLAWQKVSCVAVFGWLTVLMLSRSGNWWDIVALLSLGAAPLVILAIYLPAIRRAAQGPSA